MLEEFCEANHCDQYIHSVDGAFPQCLMVQRELSRVGSCPLRYDKIAVKAVPVVRTSVHSETGGKPAGKPGFALRPK